MTTEEVNLTREQIIATLGKEWPNECQLDKLHAENFKKRVSDFIIEQIPEKIDPKIIKICVSSGNYPPLLFALRDDGRMFLTPILAGKPIVWERIDPIPLEL